jgi:Sulfotransferase family
MAMLDTESLRETKKKEEHDDRHERFFILGCQRSGTTLTRLILESHPDVFCYDELFAYGILQQQLVEPSHSERLTRFKIPRWTEQLMEPHVVDYGPEGPCENFYRGERIIFLLREIKDNVSSMMKLPTWCETWARPIVAAKVANTPTFGLRYARELRIVEDCHDPIVGTAALYWRYKNDSFLDYIEAGLPIMGVRYEDLVNAPRPVLQAICGHLGLTISENMLHHHELPHRELFSDGTTLGNTDPQRPIDANSVGQWPQFLCENDVALIERIAGDLPRRLLRAPRMLAA